MLQTYKNSSIDWMPSPIVALATSVDDSQVAAAREDYTLEIWLVSPGAVGWHRQLTINGDPNSRVSSLVWCHAGSGGMPCGRLFSSSIDGLILEWDLFELKQKIVLDSIGVSIWQMAVAPFDNYKLHREFNQLENGSLKDNDSDHHQDSSESEDDSDVTEYHKHSVSVNPCVAIACDDGRVQIYSIPDADKFNFIRSLPRVSGRVLSIAWSPDADMIYSGSSDGLIRCWNTKLGHEVYRITVGLGGLGSGPELCVWSLLSLRCGTLVSADSTGSVHFWDSQRGTLLQTHTVHKGDVNALAAAPSHNRVYSAGSDGQVILYKLSGETVESSDSVPISIVMKKWIYVGYVRAHTHDIRALTVAVPISREGTSDKEEIEWQMKNKKKEKRGGDQFPNEEKKENGDELSHDRRRGRRDRSKRKPTDDFSYPKWAQMGVPMLISGGDDTKLFAYSIKEFTKFSPHDICPAPQRVPMQLVTNTDFNRTPLLLVQASHWLDIFCVRPKSNSFSNMACAPSESVANANLLARVTSKASRKIICSAISNCGKLFAYSDHVKPNLFELRIPRTQTHAWSVNKRQLPHGLPFAHCMIFSFDSSRLLIAGCDKRIYVVDMDSLELIHAFTPCRDVRDEKLLPSEPPITKMFTSSDGQWLAAVNCFGDVYIFNLEVLRQHWFISRLNGASVTAGGFPQWNNNVLVVTTSLNQIYAFDVEAKQLGAWSKRNSHVLPKKYQEFPGEVVGLSFPSSTGPSTVIVYSSRAMCSIDFRMSVEDDGVDRDDENSQDDTKKNIIAIINTAMDALEKQQGLKRKKKPDYLQQESKLEYHQPRKKPCNTTNFEISSFRDPVLFIGHLSENSLLKIDKPWLDVVKTLDSAPVHRHSYGT